MTNNEEAAGTVTPAASLNSLIKNQQIIDNKNYKPNTNRKGENFKCFCSFCKKELPDESIIFKGISVCTECLKPLVQFMLNPDHTNHDNPKNTKLFRCFFCDDFFTARKMSSLLVSCRLCFASTQEKDTRTKEVLIENSLRKISDYIRGQL
jgi:hypothetical protein